MSEQKNEEEFRGLEWLREQVVCQNVCATRTDVPGYIRLIAEGKFEEAYALIRETNPFPSICGRVCHHPCETHCRRSELDAPVAIDALKRFVSDYVVKNGRKIPVRQAERKQENIAIIGAGPAGLTAAHDLARSGYSVEVYDKEDIPGGMLAVGIPEYRLPKKVLNFEIDHIRDHGVKIHCGMSVGKNISFLELREKYDAVLVALGASKAGKIELPGEDTLEGFLDCLDFLRRTNRGEKTEVGKSVAVIGGGNTAVDCARMAFKLGAQVTLIYRRTRNEMPALPWEISEAEREGVRMLYLAAPVHVVDWNGRVKGLVCTRMTLGEIDDSGRRRPVPIEGSEFLVEVDSVIPAVSLRPDLSSFAGKGDDLSVTERGTIEAKDGTFETSIKAVFAAGDVVTGPKTVIDAIASGHGAAIAINRYLRGASGQQPDEAEDTLEITEVRKLEMAHNYDVINRHPMPSLPLRMRMGVFDEIELGFTEEMAVNEARRCLQCDHAVFAHDATCIACGRCSEVCPYNCIRMVTLDGEETETLAPWLQGSVRIKNEALCIRCGLCIECCPVDSVTYKKILCVKTGEEL